MSWRRRLWGQPDLENATVAGVIQPAGPRKHPLSQAWKSILDGANGWIERMEHVLTSRIYVEDTLDEDGRWEAVRPLGAGTFGVAALFQKRNDAGDVVDSIVVKTELPDANAIIGLGKNIPAEAAIMAQLNNLNTESIVYLRGFKTFPAHVKPPRERGQWRYYLEYCPYGNLDQITIRYRAWGTYLPEAFLWHIFKGLAEALKTLEHGPFHQLSQPPNSRRDDPNLFMAHLDFKPDNVYLGIPTEQQDGYITTYPMVKLADFGLAELRSLHDPGNKARRATTAKWGPPECRTELITRTRPWLPFEGRLPEGYDKSKKSILQQMYDHLLGPEANVFQLGTVMYGLMTLDRLGTFVYQPDEIVRRQDLADRGGCAIRTTQERCDGQKYSDYLYKLVRHCLAFKPIERPNINYILTSCNFMLSQNFPTPDDSSRRPDGPRLFYRGSEIRDMPSGPRDCAPPAAFWPLFNQIELWADPDEAPLNPPLRPIEYRPDIIRRREQIKAELVRRNIEERRRLEQHMTEQERLVREYEAQIGGTRSSAIILSGDAGEETSQHKVRNTQMMAERKRKRWEGSAGASLDALSPKAKKPRNPSSAGPPSGNDDVV